MANSKANKTSIGLVDTILVLVMAFTSVLLILWIAAQIRGRTLFEHAPAWLSAMLSSLWSWVTGGASSVVLAYVRRRLSRDTARPNYIAWVGLVTACILLAIALAIALVPAPPAQPPVSQVQASQFDLQFSVKAPEQTPLPSPLVLSFQQREPKVQSPTNEVPQADGRFHIRNSDLPARCDRYVGRAYIVNNQSALATDFSEPTQIEFFRNPQDPAAPLVVITDCPLGAKCAISPFDPGWAVLDRPNCPPRQASAAWNLFVAPVHAQQPPLERRTSAPGWSVPSLRTLNGMSARDRVGYTRFIIESTSVADVIQADSFNYQISVNGTPVYVDGAKPEDMIEPMPPSKRFSFAFGLENLNFSGADGGCENLAVVFRFRRGREVVKEIALTRKYAALRDASPKRVSAGGVTFDWTGQYVNSPTEDRFEVFVTSSPDISGVMKLKRDLDAARLMFRDSTIVGVVRPPLTNNLYGLLVGLLKSNGQIRFTFDRATGAELRDLALAARQRPQMARIIDARTYLRQMRGDESGPTVARACND